MIWKIEYWHNNSKNNPLEKWFSKLSEDHLKSIAKEISMLEELGCTLKLPHSKSLGQGLFELRERRYGYRIYYCFQKNALIILLAAGDKKSQDNDIKIARQRLLNT